MVNDKKKVTVGKPKTTGAIFFAPKGTTAPTSCATDLGVAFICLGYITEEGLSIGNETNAIKAWGGDEPIATKKESFKFSAMQSLDPDVLSVVYGEDNVSIDDGTGEITVASDANISQSGVWVYDTIMTGNRAKRIVVPDGTLSELGDITYKDEEAVVFPITVKANPDINGKCHYEYLAGETEESGETESGESEE